VTTAELWAVAVIVIGFATVLLKRVEYGPGEPGTDSPILGRLGRRGATLYGVLLMLSGGSVFLSPTLGWILIVLVIVSAPLFRHRP
jgi:hypothetical protein